MILSDRYNRKFVVRFVFKHGIYISVGTTPELLRYHKGIKTNTSIKRGNKKHCV